MSATIAERVAAGAALLDQRRPGWWQRIDLNTLTLSSTCGCILGQEFGGFMTGEFDLFPEDVFGEAAGRHGFDAYPGAGISAEYASLESAWTDLIEDRRAAAERAS